MDTEKAMKQALIDSNQDLIQKATALRMMVNTAGWEILLDTFEEMKKNQLEELSLLPIGDPKIPLAHAVWAATVHALDQIVSAVNQAINNGESAKRELDILTGLPEEEQWPLGY